MNFKRIIKSKQIIYLYILGAEILNFSAFFALHGGFIVGQVSCILNAILLFFCFYYIKKGIKYYDCDGNQYALIRTDTVLFISSGEYTLLKKDTLVQIQLQSKARPYKQYTHIRLVGVGEENKKGQVLRRDLTY